MILPGITTIIRIVSIVISSWLLIHVLAVFGVFVALAYPLWWYLAPTKTLCLNCQARKEIEEYCSFCREQIQKTHLHPKNLRSVFLNSALILTFSIVSIGVIHLESKVLDKAGLTLTDKTVTFIIPEKGQFRIGETFPLRIELDGIKTPINTIQADVSFDPKRLEIIDISTESSFANVFIQKEINNQVGFGRLTGGLPNPGFQTERGLFGTIFFQGKGAGLATVDFLPSTIVLANDGKGTNILKPPPSVTFLILPEHISEYEPDEELQAVSIKPMILGETAEDQIILYDESGERILGAKVEETTDSSSVEESTYTEPGESAKPSILERILGLFNKVDKFIISFWSKLFGA